jgi:integrase
MEMSIAVNRLPLDYEELKPYLESGCTLYLEVGPRGHHLERPIQIPIRAGLSLRELDIINYVVTSLSARQSGLIPWALASPAILKMATYLRRYRTSSPSTLFSYCWEVRRFCEWLGKSPDELVASALDGEGLPNPKAVKHLRDLLEEYVGELRARGHAPTSIKGATNAIRILLRVNGIDVGRILLPTSRVVYEDRAPRPEELARMMEVADLRGKVIISMLALGGFRLGTLARLRYRHVREDLERGVTPVHIHVEAEITKGKYCSYDTFIGREAVESLRLYLEQRRRGSPCGKIPPETITDESPLIRADYRREVRGLSRFGLYSIVRGIYIRAGLADERNGKLRILRPHSLRKYFRTQLAALGVPSDYIEYMMGHRISTYHDIGMKGVEFLRNIYAASGLSIRPRTSVSRIEMLKEIVRAWGMDPERILVREALTEPHRVILQPVEREEEQVRTLAGALREMLRRELLEG